MPGVGTVSTLRYAQSEFPTSGARGTGEVQISVLGIDPATYREVSGMDFQKGDPQTGVRRARTADERSSSTASWRSRRASKPGDTVTLSTPQGQLDYRVVAVAGDVLNMKINTAYISQAMMREDFNKTEDIFLQVNLAQGADRGRSTSGSRPSSRTTPSSAWSRPDSTWPNSASSSTRSSRGCTSCWRCSRCRR